jgi:FAD/FMN-containing dehydrogenase
MGRLTRRAALVAGGAALGVAGARFMASSVPETTAAAPFAQPTGGGLMNDASGLSATPIARHIVLEPDSAETLIADLRAELKAAAAGNRPLAIGAARHSMGAQAIPRDGTALTLASPAVALDRETGLYRVLAGARWSEVIAALDPQGFSPKVMQSNHDFGVAATFSVNAHGWPVPFGPMGATVRSLRLLLADGTLLTCSREENADLFAHAMGGYGLIGLIVDLEVEAVPNQLLLGEYEKVPAADFAPRFMAGVRDPLVTMAYGRLNVDRAAFFQEGLVITYREVPEPEPIPPAEGSGFVSRAAGRLYRAQIGNDRMKRFRWWTETEVGPMTGAGPVNRSTLMNEPVVTLDDRDPGRTDILHEYFVSPDRFGDFLGLCRAVIPSSYQEMLNVTLRYIAADPVSILAHSPVERIAAVMSFSQEMTARAEADMTRMTRDMIDGIIAIGGSYYLPYRPHATVEQMVRAYPRAPAFAAKKREADPALTLRNGLWDNYLVQL